jgi:hypothetical protein
MFHTGLVEKIEVQMLCSTTFSRKLCPLLDNVEKYGKARQVTDDDIIRRMRFACWITKATDTYLEYLIPTTLTRRKWLREHVSIVSEIFPAQFVLLNLLKPSGNFTYDQV